MAAAESNETKCSDILCGEDVFDRKPIATIVRRQTERYQFRATDLFYYVFSISFFFADIATDSIVFVEYFLQGHLAWGCFAMGFTVLPACVIQLFSLRWHCSDSSLKTVHWILHFLFLGFLHRYLILFYSAMYSLRNKQSFSKHKNWVYRQESDICMLHLFESFMGAAPQLILQLYIIAILHHAPVWTSASAIASFCSLTWAVSTYVRAMHNINRECNNTTWIALVLQAFWRSGMLLSRIGVLVLAAIFMRAWFLLFLGIHWLFMTIWVILQKTKFCPTVWEERIYNIIIGLIYCFDFFNLQEGKSRYRVFVFYLIVVVQNLVFLIMYMLHFGHTISIETMIVIAVSIIGGMLIGFTSMLLYYGKFHPSRTTKSVCRSINEHSNPTIAETDILGPFKLFHRGSLVSHCIDISPRVTSEEIATDKQSLLTNVAQISDCAEEGIVNCNYNSSENDSVHVSAECEKLHNRAHKEEITLPTDSSNNVFSNTTLNSLCQDLSDIDDAEIHHHHKRRGICLPITHGLEKKIISEDVNARLSSRKRRGIYEHGITTQLDWLSSDIPNIDLNLDGSEWNNSLTLDSCSKVIGALDAIKNRSRLMTPTQLESGRIFDIERASRDSQQRDETMSCVTSIHDYENVCPLGVARPPWCIRSWKGYTDIETYIHDDSVVRDRRRDTLTSTTGTTYSSEYSDGVCTVSLISRGILKQDDYADISVYDQVESKNDKPLSYNGDAFVATDIGDRDTAALYIAKPVVIDDRGGMFALDTILEEHDNSVSVTTSSSSSPSPSPSSSKEKKFHCVEPPRDSASTLVSTIDQIRRYTAENSPRHVYHTTGTQWEDLNPKNLAVRAPFTKVLFDNKLVNSPMTDSNDLIPPDNPRIVDKREIDAIREFVKCCAIESIKKTPLIDAILSDSPILGNRGKLMRQVVLEDCKDEFDTNENDLYVEMSPLVPIENSGNPCAKLSHLKNPEIEIYSKRNLSTISNKIELPNKENLAPISSNKNRWINNNNSDNRHWMIERDDKSLCNVRFNLKEKRHIFLEQVLSPPKLWNKRISFHPSTKNL